MSLLRVDGITTFGGCFPLTGTIAQLYSCSRDIFWPMGGHFTTMPSIGHEGVCLNVFHMHGTRAEASRGTTSAFLRGVLDNTIDKHTRCDLQIYTYTLFEPDNKNSKCPSTLLSLVSSGSRSRWFKEVCHTLHLERRNVVVDDE